MNINYAIKAAVDYWITTNSGNNGPIVHLQVLSEKKDMCKISINECGNGVNRGVNRGIISVYFDGQDYNCVFTYNG